MPATYVLIASNTLSSNAASVTFSSIPSTYTDLVLKYSIRTDQGLTRSTMYLRLNSDTGSTYSNTNLNGFGNTSNSFRNSNSVEMQIGQIDGASATANTFANGEIYIPSYNDSINHPLSTFNAQEDNTANDVVITGMAGLWRGGTAITSVTLKTASGSVNFVTGSSFWLYGIKSS